MKKTLSYSPLTLLPYINWDYFFHTWGMPPRFAAVAAVHNCEACRTGWVATLPDTDKAQGREAARLYVDAVALCREWGGYYEIGARFGLFPAWSEGDDICLAQDNDSDPQRLPLLRMQQVKRQDEPYLCLADFVSPHRPSTMTLDQLPIANVVGVFATAVDPEMERNEDTDDYRRLLAQTLCDRLAEAAAEKMHEDVRRHYWGYAPNEQYTVRDLFAEHYQGRRPAVGYPSLPDQSLIFVMDRLVDFSEINIRLTDNGMMMPHAAVAGLMLGHPATRHFAVGPIDEQQLKDYARRRKLPTDYLRPFLAANLRHLK